MYVNMPVPWSVWDWIPTGPSFWGSSFKVLKFAPSWQQGLKLYVSLGGMCLSILSEAYHTYHLTTFSAKQPYYSPCQPQLQRPHHEIHRHELLPSWAGERQLQQAIALLPKRLVAPQRHAKNTKKNAGPPTKTSTVGGCGWDFRVLFFSRTLLGNSVQRVGRYQEVQKWGTLCPSQKLQMGLE